MRVADRAHFVQPGNGAVHRENAIGEHQQMARTVRARLCQLRAQVIQVVVLVTVAARLAQADAVDDRRVVQRIADDRVFGTQQRLEQAAVGIERGAVEDRVLGTEKGGKARFQRLVQVLRAADEADRTEPEAMRTQRFMRGVDHPRMRRQAQVVVCAQVDDLPAVDGAHAGALRRGDHALLLEQPGLADCVEFGADECIECFGVRHGRAPGGGGQDGGRVLRSDR